MTHSRSTIFNRLKILNLDIQIFLVKHIGRRFPRTTIWALGFRDFLVKRSKNPTLQRGDLFGDVLLFSAFFYQTCTQMVFRKDEYVYLVESLGYFINL